MVLERVARVGGSAVGGGIGGFLSSPFGLGLLGVTAIGVTLFIFKDKIGEFFAGLKFPEFPDIKLPDINFPDFNFPDFPEIVFPPFPTLPTLPDLPTLCSLFGIGCDEEQEDFETSPEVTAAPDCVCGTNIVQNALGQITVTCKSCGTPDPFRDAEIFAEDFPDPQPDPTLPPIVVDPFLETEGEFIGGGPSFIGGSIGQNPVDTLFEVLGLFPKLSASGAANFLFQFSGIAPSEALDLDQFKQFQ